MSSSANVDITNLLSRWRQGEPGVEDRLAAHIYPVLKELASRQIRRNAGHITVRPTALVSDAYERIAEQKSVDWQNRGHFYAIAATVLRRVLVDQLRQQQSLKRGGDLAFVELEAAEAEPGSDGDATVDWLALDQALNQLASEDASAARLVELRLFSGLSVEEIAEVQGQSLSTIARQWRFARAWLTSHLGDAPLHG